MTATEKLQRIRAKCAELVERYPKCESVSGWNSTIAAIDHIIPLHAMLYEGITQDFCEKQMLAIIAAWPDELFE